MTVREPRKVHRRMEYETVVDAHKHGEAGKWCMDQFGTRWEAVGNQSGRWSMFWAGRDAPKKYRFCFAEEQDMVWFVLKWS